MDNLHIIFEQNSTILQAESAKAEQINQCVNRGESREDILKNDLLQGKLPKKYDIGKGELISLKDEISNAIDLIIYNSMEFSPVLNIEDTKIFPVEVVSGCIEVKSKLSKTKLLEGLENIKSYKKMEPYSNFNSKHNYPNSRPFGIVFGYSLDGNSLDSLLKNLTEWEDANDCSVWPNLIVVLGEGIIVHKDNLNNEVLLNEEITKDFEPQIMKDKTLTYEHFYIDLMYLLNNTNVGNFTLESYFNYPFRDPFLTAVLRDKTSSIKIVPLNNIKQ